jgi:hypothetical protein
MRSSSSWERTSTDRKLAEQEVGVILVDRKAEPARSLASNAAAGRNQSDAPNVPVPRPRSGWVLVGSREVLRVLGRIFKIFKIFRIFRIFNAKTPRR